MKPRKLGCGGCEKVRASKTVMRKKYVPAQSCPTLQPHGLPGTSVHGISQAWVLEWAAISSPGDLSDPGIEPAFLISPALTGSFLTISAMWEALMVASVQFSRSVVSDSLRPHELQHTRPPYPSPSPGVHSDSRPSSQ